MAEPQFTTLDELELLFSSKAKDQKINAIKLLRRISGDGLRETKDFLEQTIIPAIQSSPKPGSKPGTEPAIPDNLTGSSEKLGKPMYLVGMTYLQVNKVPVLIVGVSNYNTSYETVYSIGTDGLPIHRYNRRDHGRVTGTQDSPLNLQKVT